MRIDPRHLVTTRIVGHQQVMVNAQHDFTADAHARIHEGIQGVIDHPLGGIFHRHHTVIDGTGLHFAEDLVDGRHRQADRAFAEMLERGLLGEGASGPDRPP